MGSFFCFAFIRDQTLLTFLVFNNYNILLVLLLSMGAVVLLSTKGDMKRLINTITFVLLVYWNKNMKSWPWSYMTICHKGMVSQKSSLSARKENQRFCLWKWTCQLSLDSCKHVFCVSSKIQQLFLSQNVVVFLSKSVGY